MIFFIYFETASFGFSGIISLGNLFLYNVFLDFLLDAIIIPKINVDKLDGKII